MKVFLGGVAQRSIWLPGDAADFEVVLPGRALGSEELLQALAAMIMPTVAAIASLRLIGTRILGLLVVIGRPYRYLSVTASGKTRLRASAIPSFALSATQAREPALDLWKTEEIGSEDGSKGLWPGEIGSDKDVKRVIWSPLES